jgi:hypothetical protein
LTHAFFPRDVSTSDVLTRAHHVKSSTAAAGFHSVVAIVDASTLLAGLWPSKA